MAGKVSRQHGHLSQLFGLRQRSGRLIAFAAISFLLASGIVGNSILHPIRASAGDTYSAAVLADSPSFYYRLDESSGSMMADSSGNGYNATYSSGVTYGIAGALAGSSDTALAPNGNYAGTYSSGSGLPTGSSARTLEGWLRTTNSSGQDIASWGTSTTRGIYCLVLGGSGNQAGQWVGVETYNGANNLWYHSSRLLSDGNWHMYDAVYDGNTGVTVYVDGQSLGTTRAATLGPLRRAISRR